VAQESGGNLAEVLDNISHTVRERFKLGRELHVLTAQGRMSSNVLTGLPILLGLALLAFSPQYFKPMLNEPRGTTMLLYAAGSLLCGQVVMRRITKVKF
jgi:tight adherence protein B